VVEKEDVKEQVEEDNEEFRGVSTGRVWFDELYATAANQSARNETFQGGDALSQDICGEIANANPEIKYTERGDSEKSGAAQSAPADPSQSPFVANYLKYAQANEPENVPRERGRLRESGGAPLEGADGAARALRTQPAGTATLAGASPTPPSAEAARDKSPGTGLGELAESNYNLRSSKRVA
jgi:hypothetical protein